VESQIARLTSQHEAALTAAETRLSQERDALQQQLAVVRAQRDAAKADTEGQLERLASQHQAALRAAEARLSQERDALQQQLAVVRSQRDAAQADTEAQLERLAAEHEAALRAAEARLSQERKALQQQLAVVRAQNEAAMADDESRIAALTDEVATLKGKLAEADRALEDLRSRMQAAADAHARELAEAEASANRVRSLYDGVAEVGGRITDQGILVSLGGEELQFPSGSAALPARELPTLDRVAELMAQRPELTARIEGHTDSAGSRQLNQSLSEQRADAVLQGLVERGVDAGRLSSQGFGPDRPVADNATERGRRENRRVEIYVIE